MLSERQLARGFSYVWRQWAPHLDARLLATLRPGGDWSHAVRNWAPMMQANVPAKQNDLVAEIAFGLFCAGIEDPQRPFDKFPEAETESIVADALERVALLRRAEVISRTSIGSTHMTDACELAARLRSHLAEFDGKPLVHEPLEGAGVLSACHPDVIQGDAIIEVKMSQLSFRSADLRQLLIYAAMAHWNDRPARKLALVNPRLGLSWRFDVDELVEKAADTTPRALFGTIQRFVSEELLAW